jgi:chromosome segregation ATPase
MQHKLDDEQTTIGKKRPTAEFKVKDLKDAIDEKIVDFDAALADQANGVAATTEAATKASATAEQAAQALLDKKAAFTTLKSEPTALNGKLAEIKTLIAEVAKAEAEDDAVAMYFYLSEAAALTKGLSIPTLSDHKNHLVAAQSDVENAKTAAAAKTADSDKAAAASDTAKKAYDAARASRRTDLLAALREVKAPPPP